MGLKHLFPEFIAVTYATVLVLTWGSVWFSFASTAVLIFTLYMIRLPPPQHQINHRNGEPYIIAHRGAGFDAPENTIAAFKRAVENGATAVEFDVDYTKDGVAVVFHDDTVDRCTDGSGSLSDMTLDEVRQLDASAHHQNRNLFPGERIPTLDEVVDFCLENDLLMFIDVKSNVQLSTEKLVKLFQRYPDLYKRAFVCSFNPRIVYSVRREDRNIAGGLTHRAHYLSRKVDKTEREGPWYKKLVYPLFDVLLQWSHHCWLWYLCGSSVFLSNLDDVSESVVKHFRQRGVQVVVWTVNSPTDRRYFGDSLRCPIITDTMSEKGCGQQKN